MMILLLFPKFLKTCLSTFVIRIFYLHQLTLQSFLCFQWLAESHCYGYRNSLDTVFLYVLQLSGQKLPLC